MPMPKNREETLHREADAWDLRCKGWTEQRIADKLGVTRMAVSKILKRVSTRRYKELAAAVEEQKVVQTEQLDHILGEALDAWERSKESAEKTRTKSLGAKPEENKPPVQAAQGEDGRDHEEPEERPGMYLNDDGEEVDEEERAKVLAAVNLKPDGSIMTIVERVDEVRHQVGDPRFLKAAMEAQEAKRQIWGLDAPKRAEVSGIGGGPIKITEVVVELATGDEKGESSAGSSST
jgi:predicted transcriptional regulator